MNRKALSVILSLMLVAMVGLVVNCGGDDDGDTPAAVTPAVAKRTMVESFRDGNYVFIHGTNSPDGSKLFVSLNEATEGGTASTMTGEFTGYMLKMSDVTAGNVTSSSVLASNKITGMTAGAKTIAFRQSFTPNGAKVVQAGKDRVVVLDATTLAALNGASGDTNIGGGSASFENHDALAIDDNYAVLALQSHLTSTSDAGVAAFVLYDLNAGKAVGAAVNACTPCHTPTSAKNHFMCGIDGKLTKSGNTFTGTIFVTSTSGGHLVKVPVTIDTTNTTSPITVGTTSTVQISTAIGGAAPSNMPVYHDVRFDEAAKRVYYSTIKVATTTDATANRSMIGYVDLADDSVVRATISATDEAQAGLVYCGSGQTTDFFVPMTMSYPAYIDAVPKSLLKKDAVINP